MIKFYYQLFVILFLTPNVLCIHNSLTKSLQRSDYFQDLSNLLADMILKVKSQYCYALISDEIYNDAISSKLFDVIQGHPLFTAKIKESEDLLNPTTETYCMLTEIKKAKCDIILILISNGIQVQRLLRYGDKTRVLNTRAKFIMLHDYRLFSQSMHYIWKRIVNVIFIRLYEKSHRQGVISKPAGRLFEISTVPFPSPLKEVFVLKQVDFWQAGRYRYGGVLFQDRTSNMMGEKFKAVVLVHTPGVLSDTKQEKNESYFVDEMKTESQNIYSGLEVNILNALSDAMNFTLNYYETENAEVEKWGERYENNTFTGLLGEMDAAMADFALADLYHTQYHLEVLDLSIPYMVECLTFLTPEATTDNSWLTLILPFSPWMWAGVLFSLFSVGFIFYSVSLAYNYIQQTDFTQNKKSDTDMKTSWNIFLGWLKSKTVKINVSEQQVKMHPQEITNSRKPTLKLDQNKNLTMNPRPVIKDMFDDFSNCIIYTYSMLLYVSLPKFPMNWSLRLLTGWYWVYCILIVVAYRASMTAILSKPIPR